jgi:1,4-alpha-glucan branching enzyme
MRRIFFQPVHGGRPYSSVSGGVRCVFRLRCANDAQAVCLVGTFNEWSTIANPMSRKAGNRWETSLKLPPGAHEYAYLIVERAVAGEEPGAALFQGLVINEGSTLLVPNL